MSEHSKGINSEYSIIEAKKFYRESMELSLKFPTTHPLRLGCALSCSVFYYEILNKKKKAIEIAVKAFNNAINSKEDLPENTFKEFLFKFYLS